ncbi:MAG: deoxyguanosinetriphosphate triphosphohydrolase [Deltaproteobacteria bacterium]|nr:deoxyguanosinetriphosphate triphosphohydrolase [Deltaproteobacteria bacterium]
MKEIPRRKAEARERAVLSPFAARSGDSAGRARAEEPCPVRTAYQQDCHRVVHSKAFRRLRGKTQVFLWPEGDHYRTRLTHCQEVSQIARTLARALDLNEDLAETIALGHDLGHTPFGHAGEEALERLMPGGFRHEQQSLRVVEKLENEGRGLNLTAEVRDGILRHSKGAGPMLAVPDDELPRTLEGQIVRLADVIAYVNHDLDDALRARVLTLDEVPRDATETLGSTHSSRITRLVLDVVEHTDLESSRRISMSADAAGALDEIRAFLYRKVYYNESVHAEFRKAIDMLEHLWRYFTGDLGRFYEEFWPAALRDGTPEDDVRDFLAGMTDAFAVGLYERIFIPRRWYVY